MVTPLTDEHIRDAIAALRSPVPPPGDGQQPPHQGGEALSSSPTLVRPLWEAAESLIDSLQAGPGEIGFGLADVDVLTRKFRAGDFVVVTGFAFSGKTQLVNTMIVNNPDSKILFISLDDPAEMILAKLIAMRSGEPAVDLEARVREGDQAARAMIRQAAHDAFSNLLVVDEVIGIPAMRRAVQEATESFGQKPDAVVIDYLEMMPGSYDDQSTNVKRKANDLKGWAKVAEFPIICLHQGTRSNARPGDPITMLSLGFSGEQQATIIVGVRRKKFKTDLEAWERIQHEETITLHVVKNKRPGGRITHYGGIDFHMEPSTGLISKQPIKSPGVAVAEVSRDA